jgi:hypothetical protein
MAMTVQMQCESAVTEMYQDAFVGSSIDNGVTIITFDLRPHAFQQELGPQARLWWRQASYHVDVHELSTFHKPMTSRCLLAQGFYLDAPNPRRSFTPALQGVSTAQQMSHRVIRLACSLAVVWGVSLRHLALLLSALFLMPMTTSSIQRWIAAMGAHWPTPEERLQQWLALTPATECHLDGSYPLGTANGVMVIKEEHDRLLITHAAASEHGEDAKPCLQHVKDLGLNVTAAFSEDSPSFTEALKAVGPQARWQADHFHTVKHSWCHRKQSLLSYRRHSKAQGEASNEAQSMERAKTLWK